MTIEHGRGGSASFITFAALARTVFSLAMTPASTKPICAEMSYIFKPLLGVKSSTILCRMSEVARTAGNRCDARLYGAASSVRVAIDAIAHSRINILCIER